MKRSPVLSFTSTAFPEVLDDHRRGSAGVSGRMLAVWLARALVSRGLPAGAVIQDDFGWCIPVATVPHRTYVACAAAGGAGEHWTVFVFSEAGLFARLVGKAQRRGNIDRVLAQVRAILAASPLVRALREVER